jgi:Eukaryotic cytochrome b561
LQVIHGKQHFHTTHGKLGLAAACASLAVLAGGAVAFRRLHLLQLLPESAQPLVKRAHRWAAPAVWLAAAVNVAIGLGHPAAGPMIMLHWAQKGALLALAAVQALRLFERPCKGESDGMGKLV